jgi:outer membrane protein assembly factor BamE (lipoprotein component of BamABCDE complex)/ketosteroid isomerase-like protein
MKVIAMRYLVLLLVLLSASCTSTLPSFKPYHLDVQQGNVVTSKMMLQLKPGMSKSQVRYVMGTSLLQDSFHQDRWDYLYQMSKGGTLLERRRVILEFKNDGLVKVRGDVIAAGAPGAENAPMASIDDIKTAKSDKTLLAEDAKSSWTDRFKFWAYDDKKQGAIPVEPAIKANAEPEKSWFDSLKFWEDKEKPAAPAVIAKPVEVAKVEMVKPVAVAPIIVPVVEDAVPNAIGAQSAEPIPPVAAVELAKEAPQQKAMDEAAPVETKTEIAAMVNAWADAWRTKNVEAYLKFYSDQFAPEGMSRKAWVSQRKQRITGQSGSIGLMLEAVKIDVNGKVAQVEFLQHYSNGKFADHVTKVLSLSNDQKQWLILKESVAKSSKPRVTNDAAPVETFKLRDVTADEKSEAMPEKMIQESAKKAIEPAPVAKPMIKPVEPVKPAPTPAAKEVKPVVKEDAPAPAKVEVKAEVSKVESNKDKPLPPEDAPGYFERMLEKIGF